MTWLTRIFACLSLCALALFTVASAQEAKDAKDAKKEDKKEDKKDSKKEDKKASKDDKEKGKEPAEEKVVFDKILEGKIKRFASESSKDIVLEVLQLDPKKVINFNNWQADQLRHIASTNPKDPAERARRTIRYQQELAKKKSNPMETMTAKDVEIRALDSTKTRSLYPPLEYTDKGELKKWTAKELAALKGKSRLPGYPVDYDALRPGMFVQAYMAKVETPKGGTKKKLLDDDPDLGSAKPEVVMIVVTNEGSK